MSEKNITAPRLYVAAPLAERALVSADSAQAHYVLHVLRIKDGGTVRLFNGRDGEYIGTCRIVSKQKLEWMCGAQLRTQSEEIRPLHLLFAPIQKNRMDFLIEKSVELGVTALHPVLTARTQVRQLNRTRIQSQIIEAAEQCERLDIPVLHDPVPLKAKIMPWHETPHIHWAAERVAEAPDILDQQGMNAFLIGPEGGFDAQEQDFLAAQSVIKPISLGRRILRAETAALKCLACAR